MGTICNVPVALPNAPDLVLDLLEAHGGALAGQAICRAGVLLGHRESTMRVAMTRLLEAGKLGRRERGWYELNPDGLKLRGMLDVWTRNVVEEVPWQREWVAVHDAHVGRADKSLWRRHQLALALRGFAEFEFGLKIRPANRVGGVDVERRELKGLGLAPMATVFLLVDWDQESAQRAHRLWPTGELARDCAQCLAALDKHRRLLAKMPIERALRESFLLGRAAVMLLIRDPLLPEALMNPQLRNALANEVRSYKSMAHGMWDAWLRTSPQG
ncbi:PaaX family transcriptional regulator [Paraburkholderia acidiphila]|uniref:PaaX family transcriptional regulator n=1 Tax=Paraburkholderia acidiphila TaxID=2571747 RepID=A0A7Z2G9Q9_9BURK|nr:PaaX family transcriptional regulator [Paraburkholderia acidiphila]QGZ57731.1 PaaX family transcriptional regulator [Paraburkholderia acidiphila]